MFVLFKKNRDYGSEGVDDDFPDEGADVCAGGVDAAEAGEVGVDAFVDEMAAGIDFVDDDLAGETAPL